MSENLYETDALVNQYLLFHYGQSEEILPYAFGPHDALNFPVRCVTELVDVQCLGSGKHALDIGCAVGRSSFELARYGCEVIGIDYSAAFIGAAQELKDKGLLDYLRPHEGEVALRAVAAVPEEIDRTKVQFEVGDAMALRDDLGTFDLVIACNLICRLPRPRHFLERLTQLVKPGGQLVITTPFTWLDEYTPPEHWLGGRPETGDSFNGLRQTLEGAFVLKQEKNLPMLIKETARKYQWTVVQGTAWERRAVV
ncbi:MAG: putative 4-mercaptohistidine N1-methyltransferase [Verrucomicrobiota bacterium]